MWHGISYELYSIFTVILRMMPFSGTGSTPALDLVQSLVIQSENF